MEQLWTSPSVNTTLKELSHDDYFNKLRQDEFRRLDESGQTYLDYTGGNLYGKSQIRTHLEQLDLQVFGNPHSSNPTSKLSTKLVEMTRARVLKFFNAEDYHCIFTSNASGALNIVGESYPFHDNGHYLLFVDNHNSVNGIREYCLRAGGQYEFVRMNVEDLSISEEDLKAKIKSGKGINRLFAYPAQSNASGIKHDLKWIDFAKSHGWDVLLDAAAFVPSSSLDLNLIKPDFVPISFYKIFGYPTGLGCLLVRKTAFHKLHKRWFAGGTVSLASSITPYYFLTENHERFENGTVNYLQIPALNLGFDLIDKIGMVRLNERVTSLMDYLFENLRLLRHSNGQNQLDIFGSPDRRNMGPTMIMSFRNSDGSKLAFEKVEELANSWNISIRSGCFCNPGLDETNNCLTTSEIENYFRSRTVGNYKDMMETIHKMRGATRISVGMATNKRDLDTFISFVKSLKDI